VYVVLDTAWTPESGGRADTIALRELVAPILDRVDIFEQTFQQLDQWARALDLPGRLSIEGVSWWYRRRQSLWLWLAERVHWAAVLEELTGRIGVPTELELRTSEASLTEMAGVYAALRGVRLMVPPDSAETTGSQANPAPHAVFGPRAIHALTNRILGYRKRRGRRRRAAELSRRDALLAERRQELRSSGRPVLVLTNPAVHQMVVGPAGVRRVDPFLGSVVDRLRGTALPPVVVALNLDRRDDAVWPTIESDPAMLPDGLLATSWADPLDDEIGQGQAQAVGRALAAVEARPLEFFGVDLASSTLAELRRFSERALPGLVRTMRRVIRMIEDIRPSALVLINEYGLTEWVAAARKTGTPVIAVQHGIIIPQHVGYRHQRHPGLVLPTRTLVFGPYEARVLASEGGYEAAEVDVSGAPRLDVDAAAGPQGAGPDPVARNDAIRRQLGVKAGDQMVVFSTTRERVHRRFYWPHVMARLLDAPLPGVHLVFKLHPAETDDGSYRALVEGLARAGGFDPTPMSVVRDIDLFALLRAADAHVGLYSTVLTDAVATGTPNLIAVTQARTDLLGYVAAGVARPVRHSGDLKAALSDLAPPTEAARQAFLEDHFRPGDATGRIVAVIEALAVGSVGREPARPADGSERDVADLLSRSTPAGLPLE
jgi:hypothetical protein